jgi:hypothetical protein
MRNSNPFIDIFIILVGLFFIGYDFYKDKVRSTSDLIEINGTVQNYSFDKNISIRSTTYSYFIYLKEYSCGFQISADFVDLFDKTKFKLSVKQGDSLKILISKYDFAEIASIEKAPAFGIDSKTNEFLNPENVITEYNRKTVIVFGFVFIAAGMIFLYLDLKRRKRRNLEREKNNRESLGVSLKNI